MKQLPTIAISEETILELLKAHVVSVLSPEVVRRLRRRTLAQIATVSPEEGGEALGMTPRAFRGWCKRNGIPTLGLGYKTPRYSVRAIAAEMAKRELKPKPGSRVARFVTEKSRPEDRAA